MRKNLLCCLRLLNVPNSHIKFSTENSHYHTYSQFIMLQLPEITAASASALPVMSPPRSCLARVQRRLLAHFAVDPRAFTLFRFLMGVFALLDLTFRLLPSHGLGIEWYCSPPYLPWAPLDADDTPHTGIVHKIMFFRGPIWLQASIFAFHFVVLIFFTLSAVIPSSFTRATLHRTLPSPLAKLVLPLADASTSATLAWLLTMLMHGRTDEFNDASDKFFRLLLIWVQFAPVPTTALSPSAAPAPSAGPAPPVARTGSAGDGGSVAQWPVLTALVLRVLHALPVVRLGGRSKGSSEAVAAASAAYVNSVLSSLPEPASATSTQATPTAAPTAAKDAASGASRTPPPVLSIACVGLQWQASIIYLALVIDRIRSGYWEWMALAPGAATAVHHVLSGSLAVRRLGAILARLPYFTRAATLSTNPAEFIGGVLLLLVPAAPALEAVLRRRRAHSTEAGAWDWVLRAFICLRVAGAALLAALQLSLAAALRLPYFQAVSVFALLPVLPAAAMDAVDRGLGWALRRMGPVEGAAGAAGAAAAVVSKRVSASGDASSIQEQEQEEQEMGTVGEGGLRTRATRAGAASAAAAASAASVAALPSSALSESKTPQPRPSACSRLRGSVPWLLLLYANLLVLAYDFRLIPSLPDNGDIGEGLRLSQRWLMFSPPPETFFYWTITGHYLPSSKGDAPSDTALTGNNQPQPPPPPLPLPFDAFPAIHGEPWAHPADLTVRPRELAAAAAAVAAAAAAASGAAGGTQSDSSTAVKGNELPLTRESALAAALALSPPHAQAYASAAAAAASSRASTAAAVPAYGALQGGPSRGRQAGALPSAASQAVRLALGTAAAHSLAAAAAVGGALQSAAAAATAAAAASVAGLLPEPAPATEAAAAAAGQREGVWQGAPRLGGATYWGLLKNASAPALTPAAADTAHTSSELSLSATTPLAPVTPSAALAALELEASLASGADRTPGPWGVQATEKHRSWRLERLLWLTHERFPRPDLRARRARSFARLWCRQWAQWLLGQGVVLPEGSRRVLKMRAVGYSVEPPVLTEPEPEQGVLGIAAAWFKGVDVQRRREDVEHDVVVECPAE